MQRNVGIDVLRAVAIALVLGRHAHFPDHPLAQIWRRGGWVGVDLFFVLSGFLVAGLLFGEFRATGQMRVGRFLARRGFKIYPAFYTLIAFTVAFNAASGAAPFEWRRAAAEALFVQNYAPGMWGHTWSLAVEEHFYLMLPVLLQSSRRDRFRGFPLLVAVVSACLLLLRLLNGAWDVRNSMFATHLRLDSLLFGALLAYYYHFHRAGFLTVAAHRLPLAALGVVLLAPAFIWTLETTPAVYTWGFTAFYLGSGALLMAAIGGLPQWKIVDGAAAVGRNSYSIYLWHAAVGAWLFPAQSWAACLMYFVASVLVGIGLAKLIEFPALRLRDAILPDSRSRQAAPPLADLARAEKIAGSDGVAAEKFAGAHDALTGRL